MSGLFPDRFDPQPTLNGPRLNLRPMVEADRGTLFTVASDPEIWAQHPAHDRWKREVFDAFFNEGLACGGALIARDGDTVIGSSRYGAARAGPGEVEIGWTFLARDRWGGLWNGEMKRLMLEHAFSSGAVDAAIFLVGETNTRSRRALEAIGAKLTDRRLEAALPAGPVVHLTYRIGQEDWIRRPALADGGA